LTTILLASGSELQLALAAAQQLGAGVRVVSVPSMERFARQSPDVREAVLPSAVRRRVSIEAGVTGLWSGLVGLDGKAIGINRFGLSAPGATVFKELGVSAEAIVEAVRALP
jgi:transketolase